VVFSGFHLSCIAVLVLAETSEPVLASLLLGLYGGYLTTGDNTGCKPGCAGTNVGCSGISTLGSDDDDSAPASLTTVYLEVAAASLTTVYLTGAVRDTFLTDITTLPDEFFTTVAAAAVHIESVFDDEDSDGDDERMMRSVAAVGGLLLLLLLPIADVARRLISVTAGLTNDFIGALLPTILAGRDLSKLVLMTTILDTLPAELVNGDNADVDDLAVTAVHEAGFSSNTDGEFLNSTLGCLSVRCVVVFWPLVVSFSNNAGMDFLNSKLGCPAEPESVHCFAVFWPLIVGNRSTRLTGCCRSVVMETTVAGRFRGRPRVDTVTVSSDTGDDFTLDCSAIIHQSFVKLVTHITTKQYTISGFPLNLRNEIPQLLSDHVRRYSQSQMRQVGFYIIFSCFLLFSIPTPYHHCIPVTSVLILLFYFIYIH